MSGNCISQVVKYYIFGQKIKFLVPQAQRGLIGRGDTVIWYLIWAQNQVLWYLWYWKKAIIKWYEWKCKWYVISSLASMFWSILQWNQSNLHKNWRAPRVNDKIQNYSSFQLISDDLEIINLMLKSMYDKYVLRFLAFS